VVLKKQPLQRLITQVASGEKDSRVQVGIFSSSARIDSDLTNGDIGAVHEFGSMSQHIPQRSFLRMPLTTRLKDNVSSNWGEIILRQGFNSALRKLGVMGENTVQKAFATGGFGIWPKLKPATIARKRSSAILIDTAQLRRSISSRVV
jgi:phage gpG-like protein